MKLSLKTLLVLGTLGLAGNISHAQITGTVTVPSTTYPDLASAITALNTQGVGTGGATVVITSGNAQTAPAGGYQLGSATLNASLSSANPLTITGNGNTVTANTGTGTTDGIFFLKGVDYVTINGLNLTDATTNTTTTTQMEMGFALAKLNTTAPFDGCQYNTIKNCTITLKATNSSSKGIYAAHISGTGASLSTTGAGNADLNSYNTFSGNNISAVNYGIYLNGISSSNATYDKGNVVGGTTTGSGNTFVLGGATSTAYGVYVVYDSVISFRGNSFSIAAAQTGTVYEIYASTGIGDMNLINNNFNFNCSMTTGSVAGFYTSSGHSDPGSTFIATGNTFTGSNPVATSSYLYAFYNYYHYCTTQTFSNNTFNNITWGATSGTYTSTGYIYLMYNYYAGANNLTVDNNVVNNITKYTPGTTTSYIYGYYFYNYNATGGTFNYTNNKFKNVRNSSYYTYANYIYPGYNVQKLISKWNKLDSVNTSNATYYGYLYNYMGYYGRDSSEVAYDTATNITAVMGSSTYYSCSINNYFGYFTYAPNRGSSHHNYVDNINVSCSASATLSPSVNNYMGYYANDIHDNIISNISTTGGSVTNYLSYYGTNPEAYNNTVNNISITPGSGTMYNYVYYGTGFKFHDNRITNLTMGTGTCYGIYMYTNSGTEDSFYNNIVGPINVTGTSGVTYNHYVGGGTAGLALYNNMYPGITVPSTYAGTAIYGLYLSASLNYRVYNNTIRMALAGGTSTFGATGIYYGTGGNLDLRNNIINVNAMPAGTGTVVALRRSSGSTGTVPSNFNASSNGNIYYAPDVTNSYLYGEGTSSTAMYNTYNLTSDPNFNTPCGLYKSFMSPRESSTFRDSVLVAGTIPNTWVPSGTSYAKSVGIPTFVGFDLANIARANPPDAGALQFSGTPIDAAGPVITYTAIPATVYCTSGQTLTATITDQTGVSTTNPPRLYYKLSTENNAFGGTNNSSFNGWKYVAGTNTGGSNWSFTMNYSLLTSTPATGSTIQYFVIAEDTKTPANVGGNMISWTSSFCPTTVALPTTASAATSPMNSFTIGSATAFSAFATNYALCQSGSTTVALSPSPNGVNVQWQQSNGTGFTNITGATSPSYTTGLLTSTVYLRAQLFCGTTLLANSTVDTIAVSTPSLLTTTPASRCGIGTVNLGATANAGSIIRWFPSATSPTYIGAGNTFTTPQIGGTTTFYAAAAVKKGATESAGKGSMTPYSNYYPSGPYGVQFNLSDTSDLLSTTVYPAGTGSFEIQLTDASGTLLSGIGTNPISVTVTSANVGTAMVIPLGWTNVPSGTGYKLSTTYTYSGAPTMNIEYNAANFPYPYNSPSGNLSITNSFYSTTNYLYYYYFFYNIVATAPCYTSRTPVVATVTPAPAITASSPNVPGVCIGGTATLNVASANTGYSYVWTPSTTLSCSTCTNPTATPTAGTTYVVTATDNTTGTTAGCVAKDSVTINVSPQPTAPTVAPTSATICAGSSAALTAALSSASSATIGTGTTSLSGGQPTPYYHVYTSSHNQYLVLASELTSQGFNAGYITSLSFYATSGYTGTLSTLFQNYEIKLAGTTSTSLTTSLINSGFTSVYFAPVYTLPTAAGAVTVNFSTPFYWNGTSNLVVDVTHMNCNSCPGSPCSSWSSSVPVAQTTTTFTSAVYTYADNNCSVNTFSPTSTMYTSTYRPNMVFGGYKPDINWTTVGGLYKNSGLTTPMALTDTNKVVYASPATTTSYTAVANLLGCISPVSNAATVTVNPVPNATITATGTTLCSGFTTTLTAGQTGTGYSYQWKLNGTAVAGATANTYTTGAAGNYTVTVTNLATGCVATTATPTTVIVNPLPTDTVTAGGSTTFCNGGSVALTATVAIGTGFTYQWYNGGTAIAGANSPVYVATTSGVYTNVVTNSNGCTKTSNAITVTVNITPATITPTGSTTFCIGGTVGLQANTGTNLTYQWQQGGAPISGATSSLYTTGTSGSYTVFVTNTLTGCSAISPAVPVTVGPPPSAAITPATSAAVCDGSSLTLSTNPAPGLTYQWYKNGVAISGANGQTYTQAFTSGGGGGSFTVNVSIASQAGCNSTTPTPTVVSVNPLPTVTATAAGATTLCQGSTVQLNAGGATGLTYQWYNGTTTITGATASSYSANASGSYILKGTNSNGCVGTSTPVSVTVNPLPVVNTTLSGSTTFCQGGSVTLNANPTTGLSYQWKLNAVPISGSTGNTYLANATGNYTFTATDANGCSNTSTPVAVVVNPLPNVTLTPSSSTINVCSGSSTTISVPGAANQTYQWLQGGSTIAGATGNSYTTSNAGNYSVIVTNTATTCQATSNQAAVVINPLPLATISNSGPTTICQGDTAKLTANPGSGYSYQWKLNGNNIVGGNNIVYNAIAQGTYTVAVTNIYGCTVVSSPISLTVNPTPAAYITYNSPLAFCEGSAVVLNANAGTGLTYQWLLNGTAIGNTSAANISNTTGAYNLKVTNTYGCVGTSVPVNVTVWATPTPSITMTNYVLSAGGPYSTYQWFYNNQPIAGATTQTHVPAQNGAYKVRVTDVHNCPGTSEQFFVTALGVSSTTAVRNAIKVYPNPASSILHIDAPVKVKLILRDVSGKAVMTAENVKELDITNVANGLYLLYVNDMEGRLLKAEKITKTDL